MEADDQTLPNGWVVRQSKSRTGHHYYFNTINGLSSWKHPAHINVVCGFTKHNLDNALPWISYSVINLSTAQHICKYRLYILYQTIPHALLEPIQY